MNLIDPRTVMLLTSVMSGLMALVLLSLRRSYPSTIKGLGEWSAGLLVCFAGGLLASGRGKLPDFFTVPVGNSIIWWGLCLSYFGSQRFFGIVPRVRPWIALVACAFLLQTWFTVIDPIYHVRLSVATVFQSYLFGVHAWLIFKQPVKRFAAQLTFWVLVGCAAIQLMRFGTSFFVSIGADVLNNSPQHVIYLVGFAFFILLFSVSLVLMASGRLVMELQHRASHDSLTDALNRRHMNEICRDELERCLRHGRSMALLMMDLDRFKAINDTYGHQAGDVVLINFVGKVNALLRRPDHLGRFGGEEFVVLLPETTRDEAIHVAERIREVCARPTLGPSCTVSIGLTTNQKDDDTVDTLLARADAALYRAKGNGRNRVEAA